MNKKKEAQALLWGRILSPVLHKPHDDDRSDRQILLELTKEVFYDEEGVAKSYSLSTLKRKLKKYRKKGIKGLVAKLRNDEGKIRQGREEVLQRAIAIKKENPFRSHTQINLILRGEGFTPIPASTLLRHLKEQGVTVRKLGYEGQIVRKRWTREHTHDLWVGDFSQGPSVIDKDGKTYKTWISAFIDVHSRFLVVGIYAPTCDMDALVYSLLAAFENHGKPKAVYLDNAKVYRSNILARACLSLGIELIHRTVRDPQGGGIIERFFLTAQKQFEAEFVGKKKTPLDLEKLNLLFKAWVSEVYHKTKHSETNQTPEKRYTDGLLTPVSPIRSEDAVRYFYNEITRTVNPDFSDITINKRLYKVNEKLRGDKVIVRFPLGSLMDEVEIYSFKTQKHLGKGILHDRSERKIPDPPAIEEDTTDYAAILLKLQEQRKLNAEGQSPGKRQHRPWDLAEFSTKLCAITRTDVCSLSEYDLQMIERSYHQCKNLGMKKLRSVWSHCSPQNMQTLLIKLGE